MESWQPRVEVVTSQKSGKSAKGKVITGIFVGIGILFIIAIIIFMYFSIQAAFQKVMNNTPDYNQNFGNGYF